MKNYRIETIRNGGSNYIVRANNREEAEQNFLDGKYEWSHDLEVERNEEINNIKEVK